MNFEAICIGAIVGVLSTLITMKYRSKLDAIVRGQDRLFASYVDWCAAVNEYLRASAENREARSSVERGRIQQRPIEDLEALKSELSITMVDLRTASDKLNCSEATLRLVEPAKTLRDNASNVTGHVLRYGPATKDPIREYARLQTLLMKFCDDVELVHRVRIPLSRRAKKAEHGVEPIPPTSVQQKG